MRREEFAVMNEGELAELLNEVSYGVLGTEGADGWPELTPLNYVYHGGFVYFHGSKAGQKMKNLKASPKVTFAVSKEYAVIPSYFQDPKLACPATLQPSGCRSEAGNGKCCCRQQGRIRGR